MKFRNLQRFIIHKYQTYIKKHTTSSYSIINNMSFGILISRANNSVRLSYKIHNRYNIIILYEYRTNDRSFVDIVYSSDCINYKWSYSNMMDVVGHVTDNFYIHGGYSKNKTVRCDPNIFKFVLDHCFNKYIMCKK